MDPLRNCDSGDGGKLQFFVPDECFVGQLRIPALRREFILANPIIHRYEERAPEPAYGIRVGQVRARQAAIVFARRWKRRREMLKAGEEIDADIVQQRQIAFPIG